MGRKNNEQPEKKQKSAGRGVRVLLLLGALVLLGAGLWLFLGVKPVSGTLTWELGQDMETDPAEYLRGPAWLVKGAETDFSRVDVSRTGEYPAWIRFGGREYELTVRVEDTTAPRIVLREEPVYLALNREYEAGELVESVEDADAQVTVLAQSAAGESETLCCEKEGTFFFRIIARDGSGNAAQADIAVTAAAAPVLSGTADFFVALGETVDYLDQVTAWDEKDGDLTDKITADAGQVDLSREGSYQVSYRVENSLGIDTVSSVDVTVASGEKLQEMIGDRRADRHRDRIIGAINPYDSGTWEQDSIQDTLAYVRPAMVQLYYSDETGYSAGSGFVMEITSDTVYLCTNRHVVEKRDEWQVFFFDGTQAVGRKVGCSQVQDVAVVAVSLQDLPEELAQKLMTVHIDRDYWSGLDDRRIDVGLERVDREGGLVHISTGILLKVKQYFGWDEDTDMTEVTLVLEHGDSGSAIMDGRGNLIAMAYAYSCQPRRYWCVPLDGILQAYQEITGREVYDGAGRD